MLLVIDANILFSFFSRKSDVRFIVLHSGLELGLELRAPLLALSELDRHKDEICKKAGISDKEYEFPRTALEVFVKTIPDEFWQERKSEASKLLLEHPKDIPYIALALKLKCPIWSNDKVLKKQGKVKVFSTSELIEEFNL